MNTKRLIQSRNRFELIYRRKFASALNQQALPVIEALKSQPPESVINQIPILIQSDKIRETLDQCLTDVGRGFSFEYRRYLIQKSRKNIDIDEGWDDYFRLFILPILKRKTAEAVTSITTTTMNMLKDYIGRGINEGLGIDKIAEYVRDAMEDISAYRSRMIAQTEVISASNQASFEGANSSGIQYRKFWSNSGLEGIRESHIFAQEWSYQRDGLEPEEYFDMGNGNMMLHPGDPDGDPSEVINCYLGNQTIKSAIVSAQRFNYSGEIVEIITVGGKILSVTPNHYILTSEGMVKAKEINYRNYLVCDSKNIESINRKFTDRNNINNKIPFISEVFDSLVVKFVSKFIPSVGLDFDGDGSGGNGNVDIVNINRKLLFNSKKSFKDVGNFILKQTDTQSILIKRFCSHYFGFKGMFSTSNSIMRFFNLILSLFSTHFTPFKFFGIGLSSHHYAIFNKMPIERHSWNATIIRDLIKTDPGFIHLDKVKQIRYYNFTGHVYDFTSLTGTNIVNNIYTSNCRCTLIVEPV